MKFAAIAALAMTASAVRLSATEQAKIKLADAVLAELENTETEQSKEKFPWGLAMNIAKQLI